MKFILFDIADHCGRKILLMFYDKSNRAFNLLLGYSVLVTVAIAIDTVTIVRDSAVLD